MTGTCGLPSQSGNCGSTPTLQHRVIATKKYFIPPNSVQKAGDIPLGAVWTATDAPPPPQLEAQLDTGDDRMQQVMFANGEIFGALGTALNVNKTVKSGIEYFGVMPRFTKAGALRTSLALQGYLGNSSDDLFYPAIAVNSFSEVLVGFNVNGPDYYPSTGWFAISGIPVSANLHMLAIGMDPEDGFSGYPDPTNGITGGVARWGDYTAAAVDPNGNFWLSGEYIPFACGDAVYNSDYTCGGHREQFSNWGTGIVQIIP
ncbi:MAG TPA: hypothetical protein VIX12_00735, partial [Candidatus Binataceae bacterium]